MMKRSEIFRSRITIYKDLRLKAAIDEGMKRFGIWNRERESPTHGSNYNDGEYEVFLLTGQSNGRFTKEVEFGILC